MTFLSTTNNPLLKPPVQQFISNIKYSTILYQYYVTFQLYQLMLYYAQLIWFAFIITFHVKMPWLHLTNIYIGVQTGKYPLSVY